MQRVVERVVAPRVLPAVALEALDGVARCKFRESHVGMLLQKSTNYNLFVAKRIEKIQNRVFFCRKEQTVAKRIDLHMQSPPAAWINLVVQPRRNRETTRKANQGSAKRNILYCHSTNRLIRKLLLDLLTSGQNKSAPRTKKGVKRGLFSF